MIFDNKCVKFTLFMFLIVISHMVIVLNEYPFHSLSGWHLGSRFFTNWRLIGSLEVFSPYCGQFIIFLSLLFDTVITLHAIDILIGM